MSDNRPPYHSDEHAELERARAELARLRTALARIEESGSHVVVLDGKGTHAAHCAPCIAANALKGKLT